MQRSFRALLGLAGAAGLGSAAMAQDDGATLRQQVLDQQRQISAQQEQLRAQAEMLDKLSRKIDDLTVAGARPDIATTPSLPQTDVAQLDKFEARDGVGDLNSVAVRAGDFPGSFKIPGGRNVSLAIGGLVKGVAIVDSAGENLGASFLPAFLGTKRPDERGGLNIDASLTRLFIDGRAPIAAGVVRGYVEFDLNAANDGSNDFKLRHAYGSWDTGKGVLTVGQTWSTMMDVKILPEGLTEPTVSGAIFARQALVRWSQPLGRSATLHLGIEDPNSTDIADPSASPLPTYTRYPDVAVGLDIQSSPKAHLRLNGIARSLHVRLPGDERDRALAWGASISGHLLVGPTDKWIVSGVYGKGLGRYLLGIQPTAGSIIDPEDGSVVLRRNWGALTAFSHHWTKRLRSTAMVGHAKADALSWQPGSTFTASTYAAANLIYQVLPFLNVGAEYAYGVRVTLDDDRLDNHRLALGFQFF